MVRPIPPDKRERRRKNWMNRGRPRPSKRIKSRGLPERLDQAKKKALELLKRQQEKERRQRERELARLLRMRIGQRRGTGSWLYTLDEREEGEEGEHDRRRKRPAGAGASRQQPALLGMSSLRKKPRKALQKLRKMG